MGSTDSAECPSCHESNFLMASLTDDIAYSLDDGSGVVFASCNGCGDRLSFDVVAEKSRNPETDEEAEEVTCPSCWANSVRSVELPSDALIQLEEGYLVLDVECWDCRSNYTVQTAVKTVRTS